MSLKVVDHKLNNGKLIVTVEGANPEEVLSRPAQHAALKKAEELGYMRLSINGTSGSYPVDKRGETHDDWNSMSAEKKIAAYRNEIVLVQGL